MKKKSKSEKKPVSKNGATARVKVVHRVNGKIVKVQENALNAALFEYWQDSMDSAVNKAILPADLFDAAEVAPGGAQDGNHGIAFYDATAEEWVTFETVAGTPTETYGKKWEGSVTVSQAREVQQVAIGHSYEAGDPPFDTPYATQGFAGIALISGATYEVDWEIHLSAVT